MTASRRGRSRKTMGKTIKTTVSVPKSLRDRMRNFAGEVNWSQIASEAFERFLDGHDLKDTIWAASDTRSKL